MEILPSVHRVPNNVSGVFLLEDSRNGLTLIDTGPGRFSHAILHYINQIGRRVDELQRIIVTHRHFDHMGSAYALREATHAKVCAHSLDSPQIDGRELNRRHKGWLGLMIGAFSPIMFPMQSCTVDEELHDKQVIDLGTLGPMQILHTPGHTQGHCVLYLPSLKLLFLGDALSHERGHLQAPIDAFNDDTWQTHRSILTLTSLDVDVLLFGHGRPILRDGHLYLREAATKSREILVKNHQPTEV